MRLARRHCDTLPRTRSSSEEFQQSFLQALDNGVRLEAWGDASPSALMIGEHRRLRGCQSSPWLGSTSKVTLNRKLLSKLPSQGDGEGH